MKDGKVDRSFSEGKVWYILACVSVCEEGVPFKSYIMLSFIFLGPRFITWIKFDPSMNKKSHHQ